MPDVEGPEFFKTPFSRRAALKGIAGGGLALLLPSVLTACDGGSSQSGKTGAKGAVVPLITAGIGYTVSTKFDPALSTDVLNTSANHHLHESLLTLSPVTRTVSLGLATAMPTVSGNTATVQLRNATFHDGTKVTADDVVFSFTRISSSKLDSPLSSYVDIFKDVKAKDARTVVFSLAHPTSSTILHARLGLVSILPRAAFADGGRSFETRPIGCGPYKWGTFMQNDHITMNAYSGYTGARTGGPASVTMRIMTDGSSRVAAMSGGQVDMIDDVPYQDLANLKRMSNLTTASVPSNMASMMLFDLANKPFNDQRVRQAFMYAIDRDSITKDVFQGNCTVATSVLPPSHPDYVKPSNVYTYNPTKAKQLLSAAGYPDGVDVQLLVNSNAFVGPQGPIIQSGAAKAGFRVTVSLEATAKLFQEVVAGKFQAALTPADASIFGYDADTLLRYLWAGSLPSEWMRWEDADSKQVSSLLDQAVQSSDVAIQQKLWGQVQDIIAEDLPAMPIHFKKEVTAYQKKLTWYKPLPTPGLYVAGEHA